MTFYRYESSGYDDTSFRKYTSSPYRPTLYSSQSPNMSGQESEPQQPPQHEIVCGPSFNESLDRFRSATGSGTESDGGGPGGNYKQSTFRQQKYNTTSSTSSGVNSSIQRTAVTKQVEEQRTMISRSSQKFVSH